MSYLTKTATTLALLLAATVSYAQLAPPGYQWVHGVADPAASPVYFCEDGAPIFQDAMQSWGGAAGYFGPGTPATHTIAIGLDETCTTTVADTTFTAEADRFYQFTAIGVTDPSAFGPNPEGLDTGLKFAINDSATVNAPEGNVNFSVVHAVPDAPAVTGLVYWQGTLINNVPLGGFGSIVANLSLPSALGVVTIDVVPSADTTTVVQSIDLDLAALDGQSVTFIATGFLNPPAGAPGFSGLAVFANGTTAWLFGGPAAARTVTLKLNTASIPDTTTAADLIEIRGAVAGTAPFTLPDGNVIDWSNASTLEPTNVGGDFYEISFQAPTDQDLLFKFWSASADRAGLNTGWENDAESNGVAAEGGNFKIPAGTDDVDLPLHFFNATGTNQTYDWQPFESKADSIAVWFRVYMDTKAAIEGDFPYDPENPDQIVGVRGASPGDGVTGSPLDWGTTYPLTRERDDENSSGYHLYSGVAYYPVEAAGLTQPYKFVFEDPVAGQVGWDTDPNREFVIPTPPAGKSFAFPPDTTLHWQLFRRSPANTGIEPVTATVLFAVDLAPMEEIGIFDRGRGDTLEVRGGFNGWDCDNPDDCLLDRVPGEDVFEAAIALTAFPLSQQDYKFYLNLNDEEFLAAFGAPAPQGWEEPISTTGANRKFIFTGDPATDQDLGVQRFNDIFAENIIPEGVSVDVTFTVDMSAAIADPAAPFDPAADSVTASFVGDAIWAFTQGVPRNPATSDDPNPGFKTDAGFFQLTQSDGNTYSGTLTVTGPTYAGIQYKYAYGGAGTYTEEAGGDTSAKGRRRTRFIVPNADGSWPATFAIAAETYQPDGNLPFDDNPVATSVEEVAGEIPTEITLGDNYPNPFNPSTTFEYGITSQERVTLNVYDLTGRLIANLVDGVQPAAVYRVSFDANELASGVYIYQLKAGDAVISKKMLLVK